MKNKLISNLLAYLLAALVVATGITLPGILLKRQEEGILGNKKMFTAQEKLPITEQVPDSPQTLPNPQLLYGEELLKRVSVWVNREAEMIREPYHNEMSMENAFFTAKYELQKLMDAEAIPSFQVQEYQLSNARLKAMSRSFVSRWEMQLTYMDEMVQVEIDAQTGNIYSVALSGHEETEAYDVKRMAMMFAEYYQVEESMGEIIENKSGNVLEAAFVIRDLMIYVSSTRKSTDAPKCTIKLDSAQNFRGN